MKKRGIENAPPTTTSISSKRPAVPLQRNGLSGTGKPVLAPHSLQSTQSTAGSSEPLPQGPPPVAAPLAAASVVPMTTGEGLSIFSAVSLVYDRAGETREDFRDNYAGILERKIPKKTYAQDYKVSVK